MIGELLRPVDFYNLELLAINSFRDRHRQGAKIASEFTGYCTRRIMKNVPYALRCFWKDKFYSVLSDHAAHLAVT